MAALVGAWLPESIAGYHGPLTTAPPLIVAGLRVAPLLRFDKGSGWAGSDGCNDLSGSYELRTEGAFQFAEHASTNYRCFHSTPTPATLDAAVRIELSGNRLTFLARGGHVLAQYQRVATPPVAARCTPKQLSATFGFVNNTQDGLGSLILTNHGPSPCTLSGSPDVRVIDSHGRDLVVTESHGVAGNTPPPPPKGPITVAANGEQPQGGVPMDWGNWCRPSPGPFTLHVRLAGWATFLVATPTDNADTTPPCTDKTRGTGLDIYVVFEFDNNAGFHGP